MRRRLRWVFAAYLAVVAYGVFGPSPSEQVDRVGDRLKDLGADVGDRVAGAAPPTTFPGRGGRQAVETSRLPARPSDELVGDLSAEEFLNVLLFVPFGAMVPVCWPKSRWLAVPMGIALSAAIETIQGQFLRWRSLSIHDIQFNSLGTCVGFAVWMSGAAVVAWRQRSAQPSGNMPRRGSSV